MGRDGRETKVGNTQICLTRARGLGKSWIHIVTWMMCGIVDMYLVTVQLSLGVSWFFYG